MLNEQDIIDQTHAILAERNVEAAEQATEYVARYYDSHGHFKTGKMVGSMYYVLHRGGLGFKIVVPIFYARFLEFGTKRQPARYPLQKAVNENLPTTVAIMNGTGVG